jgi:hypothetical protein
MGIFFSVMIIYPPFSAVNHYFLPPGGQAFPPESGKQKVADAGKMPVDSG